MNSIEIIRPQYFSANFPKNPINEISRDNVAKALKQQINNLDILFVSGEVEIGKTTLLAQFANQNYKDTISIFFKPINKFSSSVENIIFDLIGQMHWILYANELPSETATNYSILSEYLIKLNRHLRGRTLYYVLDGFENIESKDLYIYNDLFEQLPFGFPNIKFLISDDVNEKVYECFLKQIVSKGKLKVNTYLCITFSFEEVATYCKDLDLKKDQVSEIYKITGAVPGKVKNVYERLKSGESYQELFSDVNRYEDLLFFQWNDVRLDEQSKQIIALLALEDIEYSVISLAGIFDKPQGLIKDLLQKYTFIEIDDEGFVNFKSSIFKNYVRSKCLKMKNEVEEKIIIHLMKSNDEIDSILELPKRYEKNRKFDELLALLDEKHFVRILEEKESFNFLEDQTFLGIKAAKELRKYNDLFRLSLQKSCLAEIKNIYISEAEIEAKIEFSDFISARKLADSSLVKEDRFRLLTFFARKKKEMGLEVEEELQNSIKTLYNQVDPSSFNDEEEVIDIATNLLYNFPELGVEFLEKGNGNMSSSASDFGFAKLAMLMRRLKKDDDDITSIDRINSKFSNPLIKNIANAFSFMYGDGKVEDFIHQVSSIESPTDRMQVIRMFLSQNHKTEKIYLAIDFAMDLIITTSNANPISASVLEDISFPLPYVPDTINLELLNKVDSFKALAKQRGPSLSYFVYQLNIGCAEIVIDEKKAIYRFMEVFFDIDGISDLGIQTECFSILYSRIVQFDKKRYLENDSALETMVIKKIKANFSDLLNENANHYKSTEKIIKEISKVNPELALTFCGQLNTRDNRNRALLSSLKSYLNNSEGMIDLSKAELFYQKILDPKLKDKACIKILNKLNEKNECAYTLYQINPYIHRIKNFYKNQNKCYAYSIGIKLLHKIAPGKRDVDILISQIEEFLGNLDDKLQQINYSFSLCTTLIPINKVVAKALHNRAVREKDQFLFNSPVTTSLYFNTLRLSVIALNPLLNDKEECENQINRIIDYSKELPSTINRIKLLSLILIQLNRAGLSNLFTKVFQENLKPFISFFLSDSNHFSHDERLSFAYAIAPVTFIFNQALCDEVINKVSPFYRDEVYDEICESFLKKKTYGLIGHVDEESIVIVFEDALSVLKILSKMSTDIMIIEVVKQLMFCSKNHSFTKEEISYLVPKLKVIISEKFPDLNNIKHNGYKIIAEAYVMKIAKIHRDDEWQSLVREAEMIPNLSDRGFTITRLASLMPENLRILTRRKVLDLALTATDSIRSYIGRVERYCDLLDTIKLINPQCFKEKLKANFQDSIKENSFDLFFTQKSLIDFAYEYDRDLAEELLKIVDEDPARRPISWKLKDHVNRLKAQKEFIDDKLESEINEVKLLAAVCENAVEKLTIGRIIPKTTEKVFSILEQAHRRPISESYSIFYYYLSNAGQKYSSTSEQIKSYIFPLFDATLKSVQMIKVLAGKNSIQLIQQDESSAIASTSSHLIVEPGDRKIALDFIKNWVQQNAVEYVKICDPYFSIDDIELIKDMYMINPELKFYVLSEFENMEAILLNQLYSDKWESIFDQEPPEITVVQVGVKANRSGSFLSPHHDRWYITHQSGLRVGTSYNSLGIGKNSEISIMSLEQAKNIEKDILDKYIRREEKYHNGQRLVYNTFNV